MTSMLKPQNEVGYREQSAQACKSYNGLLLQQPGAEVLAGMEVGSILLIYHCLSIQSFYVQQPPARCMG